MADYVELILTAIVGEGKFMNLRLIFLVYFEISMFTTNLAVFNHPFETSHFGIAHLIWI